MNSITTNLKSGIVVFLVALPLCLGIALACNVPLFSGLLAGIIGGIVVTSLSGSALSVSGPAAGLTSIVLAAVASLGSFDVFVAAVFFAGAVQIILGLAKAGTIGNYIPNAVIKGMLAGIGIILIIKQVPHLVGFDKDPEGDLDFSRSGGGNTLSDLQEMFSNFTPGAIVVGSISMVIMLVGDMKFYKRSKVLSLLPSALIAVIVGALLTLFFKDMPDFFIAPEHLVNLPVIKDFSDLKNTLVTPDFSAWQSVKFWSIVLTLAVVASLESLLSIEAADKLDPQRRDSNSNKELVAQGVGNMACGLLGALPVTAVIVRSSANITAGATNKLSAMFHGVLLFLSILFIPQLLMLIPNASLAAVLVFTGYKLTKIELFKQHYRRGLDQFLPFITTIVVMLVTDLLKGVGAGLLVAVIFIIRSNIRLAFEIVNDSIDGKPVSLLKLPQHLTFFNKGHLLKFLSTVRPGSILMIDGSINRTINPDVHDVLVDFVETAKEKNIEVQFIKYQL
jgi:MFS superfamily sulfate permease-like transporter